MLEVMCLAMTIWFECRGCPDIRDKVAVAQVVMNRRNDDTKYRRVNNACDVIAQPNQFPWYYEGVQPKINNIIDREAWYDALDLAMLVYEGDVVDYTDGAMWFHTQGLRRVWTHDKISVSVGSGVHVLWRRES
jgi:N-acetylmuramoyl-L-alanine amidase